MSDDRGAAVTDFVGPEYVTILPYRHDGIQADGAQELIDIFDAFHRARLGGAHLSVSDGYGPPGYYTIVDGELVPEPPPEPTS